MRLNLSLLLFFVFNLLLLNTTSGQSIYKEGYIINNDNTEIKGYINAKELKKNASELVFRETDSSEIKYLSTSQIKAFRVETDYYVSAVVNIDTLPETIDQLMKSQYTPDGVHKKAYYEANNVTKNRIIPTGEVKYKSGDSIYVLHPENKLVSAFLKTLVTGKINLFYLRDPTGKEHYYISTEYGNYEELNRVFYADKTDLTSLLIYEVEFYKPQLLKYMAGDKEFESRILKMHFNQNSFVDLVSDFNNSFGNKNGVVVSRPEENLYNFGIAGGVGLIDLDFKNSTNRIGYVDFNYKPLYVIGGNIGVVFPGMRRRISILTECTMRYFRSDGRSVRIPYPKYSAEFEVLSARVSPMLKVNLTRGKVQPFLSGGCFFSYNIINDNSIIENNLILRKAIVDNDLKKSEQGFSAGAGITINKLSFESRYEFGNGFSKILSINSITKAFLLTVSYSF
jgi:hypothetical protein